MHNEFQFLADRESTSPESKVYVKKSMDILDRLHFLLGKSKLDEYQLAARMGVEPYQVVQLLHGVKNFDLLTLSKFEVAFGEPIITVPENTN